MGAYKQFLASDIIVTPLLVNKGFTFLGSSSLYSASIDRFIGKNLIGTSFLSGSDPTTGQTSIQYQRLVYNSTKELYYSNYFNEEIYGSSINRRTLVVGSSPDGDRYIGKAKTPAYDNYLQSDLTYARFFPSGANALIGVLSIPEQLFGDYIQPNSFRIYSPSGSYHDDGEGNILDSNNFIIGNIIYPHGIAVFTGNIGMYDPSSSYSLSTQTRYATASYGTSIYGLIALADWSSSLSSLMLDSNVSCSFSSSYTIYETQFKCTVRENEFNYTLNPSAISSSNGQLYVNVTGSYFHPYITTIGLYDEQQNLLAIGKLSQPLPSSPTTDTTIIINLDR